MGPGVGDGAVESGSGVGIVDGIAPGTGVGVGSGTADVDSGSCVGVGLANGVGVAEVGVAVGPGVGEEDEVVSGEDVPVGWEVGVGPSLAHPLTRVASSAAIPKINRVLISSGFPPAPLQVRAKPL